MLPYTVGGTDQAKDLFGLFDDTVGAPARGGEMNLDALDPRSCCPALAAGLLVSATHVPLGMQVLERGIVFIDLAIAQIAGLGVIVADTLGVEPHGWARRPRRSPRRSPARCCSTWTETRWPEVQEALIGVTFVLAASVGILLLAANPHGGEHLKDLLVGQILWVSGAQLAVVAAAYAALLGVWFACSARLGRPGFYVVFACAVTVSVQLVGLYLVFATLIVPALAVRGLRRGKLAAGYGVAAAGYALGLAASAVTDLPSGAVVVCAMTALGAVVFALGARRVREPAAGRGG